MRSTWRQNHGITVGTSPLSWSEVPAQCSGELPVPGGISAVTRVNTEVLARPGRQGTNWVALRLFITRGKCDSMIQSSRGKGRLPGAKPVARVIYTPASLNLQTTLRRGFVIPTPEIKARRLREAR